MKLIIAGGRDFKDADVFTTAMVAWIGKYGMPDEIVSGKCPTGADAIGESWAKSNSVPLKTFEANWNLHGQSAGPKRNTKMAQYADAAIVFWDGVSRGSHNMIRQMKKIGKQLTVIPY